MIKKLLIFPLLLLTLLGTGFSIDYTEDIENFMDGKVVSDLVIEITNEMISTNFSSPLKLKINDLDFYFSDGEFIAQLDSLNETGVWGVYSHTNKIIAINVKDIYEHSILINDSHLNERVWNTLHHEVTHYLDFTGQLPDIDESLNISLDEGYVLNLQHFFNKYDSAELFSLQSATRETINFENLFFNTQAYEPIYYRAEIVARIMAMCVIENNNYSSWYEMFEYNTNTYDYQNETYSYCGNYEFHPVTDNNYNDFYKNFILSYMRYKGHAPAFNEVEEITQEGFNLIGNVIRSVTNFKLELLPILIVLILISLMTTIILLIKTTYIDIALKQKK